jgi:spectinomycin phosphotransferase
MVEPDVLSAAAVGAAVQREWAVDVTHAEHAPVGAGARHWVLGDDEGPQWFATLDTVATAEARQRLLASYDAANQLGAHLSYVVAPVRTRDARVAVDVAPGLLLSITPYIDGATGPGPFTDAERTGVAALLGDLHSFVKPRHVPVWRPVIGSSAVVQRVDLDPLLDGGWSGGPWSAPASRLVADAAPTLRQCLKHFRLLAAAVNGTAARWVVTHGEPQSGNVMRTPDGLRLLDWADVALAPRERDLHEVLGASDSEEPWYAYVEAGGRPEPLSADTVALFALQVHLTEVADAVVRFSRPHRDTAEDRRCFGDLDRGLDRLVEGWGRPG